jgi:drug/metabolite transporter (DMT)-like permease
VPSPAASTWRNLDRRMLLGDAFGVLGRASWGATTVVVRPRGCRGAGHLTLFYSCSRRAALAAGPGAGRAARPLRLTPSSVGSVLFQGVVVSFFSYFSWFWLLRRYLASNLAVFSFMTPLFGVTFGVLILDEPLTLNFVAGAVLVLLGITLVSSEAWIRRLLRGDKRART